MTAYDRLEARFRRIAGVEQATAMLDWDAAAMMPAGGAAARAEQLATLKLVLHEQLVAADVADLLDRAEDEAAATADDETEAEPVEAEEAPAEAEGAAEEGEQAAADEPADAEEFEEEIEDDDEEDDNLLEEVEEDEDDVSGIIDTDIEKDER